MESVIIKRKTRADFITLTETGVKIVDCYIDAVERVHEPKLVMKDRLIWVT